MPLGSDARQRPPGGLPDDDEWAAIHAPINSAACYELYVQTMRERWLAENAAKKGTAYAGNS